MADGSLSPAGARRAPAPEARRPRVADVRKAADPILLMRDLAHAVDCAHPDCTRCEQIGRRLEEPELWGERAVAEELERAEIVMERAAELIRALDLRQGVDRQRQVSAAMKALRAVAKGEWMTESRFPKAERRAIAKHVVDNDMVRPQIIMLAAEKGVAPTTIYNWCRAYLDDVRDGVVPLAGTQHVPPTAAAPVAPPPAVAPTAVAVAVPAPPPVIAEPLRPVVERVAAPSPGVRERVLSLTERLAGLAEKALEQP